MFTICFAFSFLFWIAGVRGQSTAAGAVYGQQGSFTTGTGNQGGLSANSLQTPIGLALDSTQNLYVTDAGNHRVLFYLKGSTTATRVYGQGNSFTANTANNGGVTANSLAGPTDVAVDSTNGVYIADRGNHRVLFYLSGSTTATRVYGQLNSFTTNIQRNGGLNANSLFNPSGLTLDTAGNLYVADASNNRVLFFLAGSTTATRVYGQTGNMNTWNFVPINADGLNGPNDVKLDSAGNVYIVDSGNSRALFYLGASTTATRVYGQFGSFTSGDFSNPGGVSADTLSQPKGVAVSSTNIVYITDTGNYRVLRYPVGNTTADAVYGQPGFTTNIANNGGISASTVNLPYRPLLTDNGDMYLSDGGNSRVLLYSPSGGGGGGGPTIPAGNQSNTCFHHTTRITYKGRFYTLAELQAGKEVECIIPHIVKATGVKLKISCPRTRRVTLILTEDHLVFTKTGYVPAGKLTASHLVRRHYGDRSPFDEDCHVSSATKTTVEEEYFGLNCLESKVLANSIEVSTFGRFHGLPSLWMKTVGMLFGIQKASSWGDAFVSFLSKQGAY